ncbi:MAG: hypothetical protein R2749_15680 [Acidimicrobiales bacterium]
MIPFTHRLVAPGEPVDAEFRRQLVLDTMVQVGFISKGEADAAKALPLWLVTDGAPPGPVTAVSPAPEKGAFSNPYFVDYIQEELLRKYGAETLYRGGLRIDTSLDPTLQQLAQTAVSDRLASYDPSVEMAMAVVDPRTGHVKAMVGGRTTTSARSTFATGGLPGMQPGSSMKAFTLAAVLELRLPARLHRASPWPSTPCPAATVRAARSRTRRARATVRRRCGWPRRAPSTPPMPRSPTIGVPAVAEMSHRVGVSAITPTATTA